MTDTTAARHGSRRAPARRVLADSLTHGGAAFGIINGIILLLLMLAADFTSPLYPEFAELGDPNFFRLAGRIWAEGGLPYVDYWDQKGPLIFFTNMLGYLLTGNGHGVFWIDVALMLTTMYLVWRLVNELLAARPLWTRTLALWTPILWYIALMTPTLDMTETVCLPFLAAGTWLAVRDARRLDSGNGEVSWATAIVLGLGFSAGLLTRLTNALMVCMFALVLAIALAARGCWACLGRCVVGFLAGALVLAAPFVAYFAANGALYDAAYGTIIFNISYAEGTTDPLISDILSRSAAEMLYVPVLLAALAVITMAASRKTDTLHIMLLLTGITLIGLLLVSKAYPHYASVGAILLPCVFAMAFRVRWKAAGIGLLVLALAYSLAWTASQYVHARTWGTYENATVERIAQQSDSIALYNLPTTAYLRYDINPAYPLASVQDWEASFSDSYKDWLLDMYGKGDAEYILVQQTPEYPVTIQPVLDSRYKLIDKGEDGTLVYQLADKNQ